MQKLDRYRNKELVLVTWNFTKFLGFCWDVINVHFLIHSYIFSPIFLLAPQKIWSFLSITRPETFFTHKFPIVGHGISICVWTLTMKSQRYLNVFRIGTKKGFLDNELWVDRVDFNPWKPYCVISFHGSHRICILQHKKNITLNRENNKSL